MDPLKISTRLHLLILGLLALLGIVAATSLVGLHQADAALQKVFERSVSPMAALAQVQERLLHNRLAVAGALVTPDDATIDRSLAAVGENIAVVDKLWKQYAAGRMADEERRLAERFAEHRRDFVHQGLLPVVEALKQRDIDLANHLVEQALSPRHAAVGADLQALMEHLVKSAHAEHAAALDRYGVVRNLCSALCVAAAAAALGFGRLLGRSIGSALPRAIDGAATVARGELSEPLNAQGHNEIARLLSSLERMRGGLADVVATASAQIAQGHSDLSRGKEEGAAALGQTDAGSTGSSTGR